MAGLTQQLDRLFEQAERDLALLQASVAGCGRSAAPDLRLQRGHQYRYDAQQTTITILLPDLRAPLGKLFLLYLQDLLSCPHEAELVEYLSLLQQFGIAHELAHHLRDRYGCYEGEKLWQEEQLANRFAAAFVHDRLTPAELSRARTLLQRSVNGMVSAERSWVDLARTFDRPELALRLIGEAAGPLLPSATVEATMRQDVGAYIFYTFGWIYLSLALPADETVAAWVTRALDVELTTVGEKYGERPLGRSPTG